jgi:hypothetical protein
MDAFEQVIAANYSQHEEDLTELNEFALAGVILTAEVYAYLRGYNQKGTSL